MPPLAPTAAASRRRLAEPSWSMDGPSRTAVQHMATIHAGRQALLKQARRGVVSAPAHADPALLFSHSSTALPPSNSGAAVHQQRRTAAGVRPAACAMAGATARVRHGLRVRPRVHTHLPHGGCLLLPPLAPDLWVGAGAVEGAAQPGARVRSRPQRLRLHQLPLPLRGAQRRAVRPTILRARTPAAGVCVGCVWGMCVARRAPCCSVL